ncbi:unannotated protein [freshwater metagenome]|uniref:Unannotated protein n=1 Tax=freshwater metagenome TaxID=449393 RepID=A0A6J7HZU9_9ZZZZ
MLRSRSTGTHNGTAFLAVPLRVTPKEMNQ